MKRSTLSLALVMIALPALGADPPTTNVRLLARPALDEATRSAHMTQAQEADAKLAALGADLEARHGKKRKNWPAEAQERYQAAEEAAERAADLAWYAANVQQDMDDTLADLTAAIGKKKRFNIVASDEEADLVVEILGRARGRHAGAFGKSPHLALLLKAGPRVDPGVVQRLKMEFTVGLKRRMPAFESEDPPSVALEIAGSGLAWRLATKMAADELDYMVKKNGELLASSSAASAK
jgi:hypothetical protein